MDEWGLIKSIGLPVQLEADCLVTLCWAGRSRRTGIRTRMGKHFFRRVTGVGLCSGSMHILRDLLDG